MKDLEVGSTYKLIYTGDFCHAVGFKGSKKFSPCMNHGDTVEAIYVGTINLGDADSLTMVRDIFYAKYDPKRNYLMYAVTNRSYVISKN